MVKDTTVHGLKNIQFYQNDRMLSEMDQYGSKSIQITTAQSRIPPGHFQHPRDPQKWGGGEN